tara:strand:+ start:792 stop:1019 length:228 start_codon:yes stop_codon:yes gene_type:complete
MQVRRALDRQERGNGEGEVGVGEREKDKFIRTYIMRDTHNITINTFMIQNCCDLSSHGLPDIGVNIQRFGCPSIA